MTGPRRTPLRQALTSLVAVVFLLQAGGHATCADEVSADPDHATIAGRRMFFGESPLLAAIAGHPEALPTKVIACANCHLADKTTGSGAAFAPKLNQSTLTQLRSRRGGPPSLFSPASFCRLLRTGVDPAYILIPRQMPRYILPDDQCLDLWRYLTESPDARSQE